MSDATPVSESFVLIGGGLASAKAAETLRSEGFGGRIALVARENERPYERPPLSKGYLAGTQTRDQAYVHDLAWYAEHHVELLQGMPATELDIDAHEVVLADGRRLSFDKLLLATGSDPRRLSSPGADLDGIRYLRRLADADTLLAELSVGNRRVVIVGGGWIGLEVASAARGHGNDVTIVEPQPTVLRAVLGDELGGVFADLHRAHGVRLILDAGVREFGGTDGRVSSVRLSSGDDVAADVVVVGVGAQPNVGLAQSAGLDVDNGVLTDETLRTSHPDVFAAGDIANAFHPLFDRHVRVEHWANALNQGPAAARSMLGQPAPYERLPYFYTDQYDLGMEYTGYVPPEGHDEVVIRGDLSSRTFIAFWLKDSRVVAGMNVNTWDVTDPIQALIRSGTAVDSARLTDVNIPLDEVGG